MLEWLAATTGIELGKLVLEQVLDLSKPVLEGYVQDFFKDCLSSGVSRLNASALKTPMAEAIGYFIKRFVKELQINDVPETSIQHHYKAVIKKFVQDKAVRPILGKAFEKDCKQIDYAQLGQIWAQQYQDSGWQFPSEEFDWRGVCKEYVYEVKGIVKANPELREILNSDLLEDIVRNTAQLSPGFDVETYRDSLQSSYGYLKLYTLDSTDRVDAIKLWAIFIEQTVREALPPMRYDLPSDLKRQLQASGQLEADLSPEALEHYRHEYFQQPTRKVLEAVADSQRAVILGDPGSGKSSFLQYLALEWVEGNTEKLPLLIELREFALNPSANFLEFLHRGRGVDWQFDQQQLHQHLLELPMLIMFDGLDEVFDRTTQSTIIDDIIRFSQQYPKAQVLVTSRVIGYSPDRLQHSEFRHFTIQSLDTDEIHEFIDRWYDLSLGNDPDKVRLKQRLKDAIAMSKAIANLADNPLLLTMMAILNRRQELPRDRSDLYDQASRVLLYHWDVDHKRLQIPMDAIGRREKQEMLRLIAYEMQAGEEGLKGNLISAERLTRILTDYLRDQGFSEPREKANRLIQQLRDRNFILCYRGADTYGFMHRTFLEYFCAVEIVYRFEKQRTLTFEQLRDEVFGQHWQDETWHEVLLLLSGLVESQIAGEILEYLLEQYQDSSNLLSLKLASLCLLETKNRHQIKAVDEKLINLLMSLVELWRYPSTTTFGENDEEPCAQICELIGKCWKYNSTLFTWLQSIIKSDNDSSFIALRDLGANWKNEAEVSTWIKVLAENSTDRSIQKASILALTDPNGGDRNDLELFNILQSLYRQNIAPVSQSAIFGLFETWMDLPETISILRECLVHEDPYMRWPAVNTLAINWQDDPDTLPTLKKYLQDESHIVRGITLKALMRNEAWRDLPEVAEAIFYMAGNDPYENEDGDDRDWDDNLRLQALKAIISHYSTHPKTLELLRDRALNDPDKQLQAWAQEQLQQMENQGGSSEWT
ncbi:MAG: HEAT repeat domain-containing protein [Nodosilinea sp.]